jgi:uncharacterized membrane protein YdjX (TVP38/TMEM64 family)
MKRFGSLFPLFLLIAGGIAMIASGALDRFRPEHLAQEQSHLQELILAHPLLAALSQIGAMTLAIATGIPGAVVIILAGGMLFGVAYGALLSSIGLTLGAVILYFASRNAFGSHIGVAAPPFVERLRTGYLAHPFSYTLFLRLVPFIPFGAVTVSLAWLRCPLWLFTACTALGGSVMVAFETALGAGLAKKIAEQGAIKLDLFSEPGVILPMVGLGLLALIPILVSKLRGQPVVPK